MFQTLRFKEISALIFFILLLNLGSGVTTYSVHPGAVSDTELMRHITVWNLPILDYICRAVVWPFTKNSWYGAQTQICCAVSEELGQETGKYYRYY